MRLSSSSCSSSFWLRGRKFDTFASLGRMVAARPPPLTVAIPPDNIAAVRKPAAGATAALSGEERSPHGNAMESLQGLVHGLACGDPRPGLLDRDARGRVRGWV